MLILPIKGKWFYQIRTHKKLEEYRDIKPYYDLRFKRVFKVALNDAGELIGEDGAVVTETAKKWIGLKNGYSDRAPVLYVFASLKVGYGRTDWGAERGQKYYILKIHSVSEERPRKVAEDVEGGIF